VVSSQVRREQQAALACERCLLKRHVCELVEIPRSSGLRYRSVRAERDRPGLEAMRRVVVHCPATAIGEFECS